MTGSCPVGASVCRDAHAEVERLRSELTAVIDDWEAVGRGNLHPLIRGAALSAAGRVRDVLWPEAGERNA